MRSVPGGKSEAPLGLSASGVQALAEWAREAYPALTRADLEEQVAACLDWHRANGKRRTDWMATLRNWVRKEERIRRERAQARIGARTALRIDKSIEPDRWERFRLRTGKMHPDDPRQRGQQPLLPEGK